MKTKTFCLKLLFLLLVFFLASGVWYSPIVFKGYPIQTIPMEIILARNYHESGVLAGQNDFNVTISSSLVREEGHPLAMSQYLRSYLLAKIFAITGLLSYNQLILLSSVLYALVLIFFGALILYLFDFRIAIIFSLFYIFIPFGFGLTFGLGVYEFCLLFWALFFIFYFLGVKKEEGGQNKFSVLAFIISGIFLANSCLSKEVTFVFALILFLFLIIKKQKKRLALIFLPFVLIVLSFWVPSFLRGENRYLSLLGGKAGEESVFSHYLHLFPDPYTYYFEREEFLKEFSQEDLGLAENLESRKVLKHYGFENFTISKRFFVGTYLLFQHLFRFFSLEEFGGPFVTLLLILGFLYLRDKFRELYGLSLLWLIFSFLIFSYVLLVSRSHLADFTWLLVLLVVLGLIYLLDILKEYFGLGGKKFVFLQVLVVGLILYHFVLVEHAVLGRKYDKDFVPRSLTYAKEIEKLEIADFEVIAIPDDFPGQDTTLNYLTDKSLVIFKSSTLEKLIKEGKIKEAFLAFGVRYILGYSDELSAKLVEQTGAVNIASNSLEVKIEEVSADKSFFMNLVR